MAATNQNFEMHSGDTRILNFTVYQADGTTVQNITGATINWKASPFSDEDELAPFSTTVSISKDTTSGITLTDPVNGLCEVALDPADTDALKGLYYHELQVTDGSGNIATVATGLITIYGDLITP